MPKKYIDDGVEVELDDNVDPAEFERRCEQSADARDDEAIDWDEVARAAADDSHVTETADE